MEQSHLYEPEGRAAELGIGRHDLQLGHCTATISDDAEHAKVTPWFWVVPLQGNHLIASSQMLGRRGHVQLGIAMQQLLCSGPVACLIPLVQTSHQLFWRHLAMVSESVTCCSAGVRQVLSCIHIMIKSRQAGKLYRVMPKSRRRLMQIQPNDDPTSVRSSTPNGKRSVRCTRTCARQPGWPGRDVVIGGRIAKSPASCRPP